MLSYTRAMRARRTVMVLPALTICVALMAAACGGGSDGASVDSVPPTVATTTTAPTTTIATTSTTTTEAPILDGEPAFDSASTVSTVGIDRLIFGMTLPAAEEALAATFVRVEPDGPTDCYQIRPTGGPLGVELTVTAGTIERVDITTELITTRSGAGVGKTETELTELFGDRLTSASREGGGNTITFTPVDEGDKQFRVIFETDGAVVTSFRSGRVPIVEPTTPCST